MSMRRNRGTKTPKAFFLIFALVMAAALAVAYLIPTNEFPLKVLIFSMVTVFGSLGGVYLYSRIARK